MRKPLYSILVYVCVAFHLYGHWWPDLAFKMATRSKKNLHFKFIISSFILKVIRCLRQWVTWPQILYRTIQTNFLNLFQTNWDWRYTKTCKAILLLGFNLFNSRKSSMFSVSYLYLEQPLCIRVPSKFSWCRTNDRLEPHGLKNSDRHLTSYN